MEALIDIINLSSCYDMIEQYCADILNQLSALQKQRYFLFDSPELSAFGKFLEKTVCGLLFSWKCLVKIWWVELYLPNYLNILFLSFLLLVGDYSSAL
jgi:hypothetical protein